MPGYSNELFASALFQLFEVGFDGVAVLGGHTASVGNNQGRTLGGAIPKHDYLGETHGIGSSRSGHAVTKRGEVSQTRDPSLPLWRQAEPGGEE